MIEATALLWGAQPVAGLLLVAALVLFLVNAVRLVAIDARVHLLPNRIIFPWYPIALLLLVLAAAMAGEMMTALRVVVSGVALFLFYLLLHVINPGGMGLGDVKLAGILGMYLGFLSWSHLLFGTLLAFVTGALWAGALMVLRRANRKSTFAFGPFMFLGTTAALFMTV
ncbi:prepilin peptidase [Paeniglutamicibacter cryotolerans]|uniref:Leader peptidase (Prepilin peptidase)/N-methyltransferase n=2 Tax=Paeniglutamicibacter cryotolerans TaxID=670079 RepID=A0A839QK10_9MICC|nr:leader peptidase (prepilin peptidase)/N-methyltransferase [Paeniglutamicibacter cryotolerans]